MGFGQFNLRAWRSANQYTRTVHVSRPEQLACFTRFSAQEGGALALNDNTGLMPLKSVQLPIDLNEGYPTSFQRKDEDAPVGVEPILQAVIQAGWQFSGCDVCTFRNNLNKIAMTLLNPKDPWTVDGCQAGPKTLFLDIHKTPEAGFPGQDRFMYYGYKFEALCTGSSTVDATSEFCSVNRLRLGQHSIFLGAEVDAYDESSDLQTASRPHLASFVELKTYKLPSSRAQDVNIKRFKHPRWWVQSFLAGVPNLVLGGRDAEGILKAVQRVRVSDLHRQSVQLGCDWDPNCYLQLLVDVLAWMRHQSERKPGEHMRFSYDGAQQAITCCTVPDGSLPSRLSSLLQTGDADKAEQKSMSKK